MLALKHKNCLERLTLCLRINAWMTKMLRVGWKAAQGLSRGIKYYCHPGHLFPMRVSASSVVSVNGLRISKYAVLAWASPLSAHSHIRVPTVRFCLRAPQLIPASRLQSTRPSSGLPSCSRHWPLTVLSPTLHSLSASCQFCL